MLELKDICFQVSEDTADKEILKNINLKLDDRFIAITGPNGGGKSTLAKMIAGIIKPTSGKILLDGVDITDYSRDELDEVGKILTINTDKEAILEGFEHSFISLEEQVTDSRASFAQALRHIGIEENIIEELFNVYKENGAKG